MASWPSTIPVSRENYQEMSPNRVTRSNMDVGPQKIRRRSSSAVRPINLRLMLTDDQLQTIDDFYNDNDAAAFDFIDPRTGDTKRARFADAPSYNLKETMWDVSIKMEYLP